MNGEYGDLDALDGNAFEEVVFRILRAAGLVFAGSSAAAAGQVELLTQKSMAAETPALLPLADLQEAARRGLTDSATIENALTRYGYSPQARRVLDSLREQLLGAGEHVEMLKRKAIDWPEYAARMQRLGFNAEAAADIASLSEYVPTAPDVVQFAVREVYTPEIAQKYGQFEDFPRDALTDFARAGLPEDQARKYWAAHWQLPSLEQGIAMYHRRAETGFALDDVLQLMRALDVMPFYRDKLLTIASNPYTRVDVRRMHKLGILNVEQVEQAYQELGYNDERAHNLALFTEAINAQETDDALEPWRAGLRSRAISMYQNRTLPESDLRQVLGDLGYSHDQVSAFVAEATFIREASVYDDWRASIKRLYVGGYWTREHAITRMLDLGFTEDEVIDLIPLWDVDRELREETAEERAQKDLTKTEIIAAYKDAIMPEQEAHDSLLALGYDAAEADRLLALADAAVKSHTDGRTIRKVVVVTGSLVSVVVS